MRIGAEDRNRIIILGVLLLIAAFAVPRIFSGGSSATPGQSQTSAATTQRTANATARSGKKAPPRKLMLAQSDDPSLRFDLLKQGEGQEYEGSKRNIFSDIAEIPPPIVDPNKSGKNTPPPPVVPPGPPPIPLKFYGFATQAGQAKRVFLSSTTSDDIFVGSEGQVINKRYRIVKIENADVIVEDILNNNQQKLVLSPPS